jgi:hypothetical protein
MTDHTTRPSFIALPQHAKDITGQRFCRLVALGPIGREKDGKLIWCCRCDCGTITNVRGSALGSNTQSCGCQRREKATRNHTTHGMSGESTHSTWSTMIQRCTNPHNRKYPRYGGRGIEVYAEWRHDFQAFHDHVSRLPNYGEPNHTLDRIDNDGNYEPGNVRWADPITQRRNNRNLTLLTFNGETQCLTDWAEQTGIDRRTIMKRIRRGWTIERALNTPSMSNPPKP